MTRTPGRWIVIDEKYSRMHPSAIRLCRQVTASEMKGQSASGFEQERRNFGEKFFAVKLDHPCFLVGQLPAHHHRYESFTRP